LLDEDLEGMELAFLFRSALSACSAIMLSISAREVWWHVHKWVYTVHT